MPERPPTLRERLDLKYWVFRALATIVPLTPLRLAQRIATAVGLLLWLGAGRLRQRAARNQIGRAHV